jgi:hypothetical protein
MINVLKKLNIMKFKNLVLVALFVFLVGNSNAQCFKNGDWNLNTALGFGRIGYVTGTESWPALHGSVEKGIVNINNFGIISAGGLLAVNHVVYDRFGYDDSWNELYIGGRAAFYFSKVKAKNLDLYAGVTIGLRYYSDVDYDGGDYNEKAHSVPFSGAFGGVKYYFKNDLAVFGELGPDIMWLKLGLTFKL